MKTKRRHELQTNELADWLGKQIERLKPYSQYLLAGSIVVVAVAGLVAYQNAGQKAKKAAAWNDYLEAANQRRPDALKEVASKHPESPAALWALQTAGDILLEEGTNLLYSDRESAQEILGKARDNFQIVLNRAEGQPMLRRRAQFALAKTLESLGELDQAQQHYAQLVEAAPDSVIGKLAARYLRRLKDRSTKEFYGLLAKYEPPSRESASGSSPGQASDDTLLDSPDLPDRPDLSFPGDEPAKTGGAADAPSQREDSSQ